MATGGSQKCATTCISHIEGQGAYSYVGGFQAPGRVIPRDRKRAWGTGSGNFIGMAFHCLMEDEATNLVLVTEVLRIGLISITNGLVSILNRRVNVSEASQNHHASNAPRTYSLSQCFPRLF